MFYKMLRMKKTYSLLYRDLLLFILYFGIFNFQIPLLILWYLAVEYFLINMYVFSSYHIIYIYIGSRKKVFVKDSMSKRKIMSFLLFHFLDYQMDYYDV